jgi:translation elongation factor EF-Tu-like GTPase
MTFELIQPIAVEEGLGFAIRKGRRALAAGKVTQPTRGRDARLGSFVIA